MKVLVTGDIHADFNHLNTLINDKNPDLLLACGDFGYWPKEFLKDEDTSIYSYSIGSRKRKIKPMPQLSDIKIQKSQIRFCDGNHENHWALGALTNLEIVPNIFYQPRGSIYTLPDGRNILFFGGADSIDKNLRTVGYDWFPEENISQKDMFNLPDCKIDIIISHTCPTEFLPSLTKCKGISFTKGRDSNCEALSQILNIYKPKLWYFGHWHVNCTDFIKDCRFYAMSLTKDTHWWRWLE